MSIISIFMQKGGSGKTTTTLNLAAALLQKGRTVLVVDADPQANLTQGLGIVAEPEQNLFTELKKEIAGENSDLQRVILQTNSGIPLVPASIELASAELELVSVYGREKVFTWLLETLKKQYDYIFIDCPPSISMLTVNALAASDYILIPLQAEFLHLKGLSNFMIHFNKIKKGLNDKLEILGLILTKYSRQKNMHKYVRKVLIKDFDDKLFDTCIRTNIALAEAQEKGTDIFHYRKRSNGAEDYKSLAEEFLLRVEKKKT